LKKRRVNILKKWLSRVIIIACLGVFFYAAHGLVDIFSDYYKNRKVLNSAQETYYKVTKAEEKEPEETRGNQSEIQPQFVEILEENEDVVGWITIDDTNIDYPVLQAEDNAYYLTKNLEGEESRAGSIFLDYRNDIQSDDEKNIVVYGHRMKDGSMFKHLTKFLDEDYFESHRTFTFDTLYDRYEAEVFAVYNTLTDFNYIETDFADDEDYKKLLEKIHDKSLFEADVDVSANDSIITLSTCDYALDEEDGRLVLHAKLTKQ